jgi:hypothetical protein
MKIGNDPVYVTLDGCVGKVTGTNYAEGQFLLKPFLTHKEKADTIRLTELLLRNIERNQDAIMFYSAIAQLAFHIVEFPSWWTDRGLDLYDSEPVWALLEKVSEIQNPNKDKKDEEKKPEA